MIEFPGFRPRYFPRDFTPDDSSVQEIASALEGGSAQSVQQVGTDPREAIPKAFAFQLPRASYTNPKTRNLLFDFYNWHDQPHFIAVGDNDAFPKKEYKRITNNHFQGIQRLNNGKHVVLSGGSKKSGCSNLFITRLGSHGRKTEPIGTNLLRKSIPDRKDILEAIILLDDEAYWHAGGISICGDILVVPLEGDGLGSRILFLNMKNPTQPIQYQNEIFRPNKKAGAAALIRLPNGHFLCAVWTEDTGHHFDFYLSDQPDITSTYFKHVLRFDYQRIRNRNKKEPSFQGISFVQQGHLIYIIGTGNTQKLAPVIRGVNYAYLFEIRLRAETTVSNTPQLLAMDILQVGKRTFGNGKNFYDMGAAGGVFVSRGGRVSMYSGHHWRRKSMLRFAEFDPPLMASDPELTQLEGATIELYQHKNFKGRCLKLLGVQADDTAIADYRQIFVQKMDYENQVSSIRVHLPKGLRYALYDNRSFQGLERVITGNGFLQEFPDLGGFNDRICSSKYLDI
ncbi:MAG: hypothetical protein AAF985_02000 [Bacteroidota bacterium]